jgi:hypothetical protein
MRYLCYINQAWKEISTKHLSFKRYCRSIGIYKIFVSDDSTELRNFELTVET